MTDVYAVTPTKMHLTSSIEYVVWDGTDASADAICALWLKAEKESKLEESTTDFSIISRLTDAGSILDVYCTEYGIRQQLAVGDALVVDKHVSVGPYDMGTTIGIFKEKQLNELFERIFHHTNKKVQETVPKNLVSNPSYDYYFDGDSVNKNDKKDKDVWEYSYTNTGIGHDEAEDCCTKSADKTADDKYAADVMFSGSSSFGVHLVSNTPIVADWDINCVHVTNDDGTLLIANATDVKYIEFR